MMTYDIRNYLRDFTGECEIKEELERSMNHYLKCSHSVPVVNGTVAIEVVLKALDIPLGSCVIVPDISFIATATAVANCGLIPVYADIGREYFGITLEEVEKKYSSDVTAVILVHFAGIMNREIFKIKAFCEEKGIYLIEDCAQALSCSANGEMAGTIGHAGTFSFQSSKIVNIGEGGMITTNSKDIAAKCEAIANWGLSREYAARNLEIPSGNYRISAVQAYFIIKQLEIIDELIRERHQKITELIEGCKRVGIDVLLPSREDRFIDMPFFLPIGSTRKINTIEPRMEYPMRNSTIVNSIIKRFFPENFRRYLALNSCDNSKLNSTKILKEVDFIYISQNLKKECEAVLECYR